jgi:hypothetical protein
MDLGHWDFPHEFDITEWFGFIYRIVEIPTGRQYIGKKQFFSHRTKAVKGKKNRKHFIKESDWKTYTSSSIELNKSIESLGKCNYKFSIQSLHKTKGSLHYREVELQITENVLREKFEDGTRKYYNGHIAAVKFVPPTEHSDETRMKISKTLLDRYVDKSNHWYNQMSDDEKDAFVNNFIKGDNHPTKRSRTLEEYQSWLDEHMRGVNNPMYGKDPVNKGKTYEDTYGDVRAAELKEHLSKICGRSGEANGMYGKTHTDDVKAKISSSNVGKQVGENNPMFNTPCYYKMSDDEIVEWKNNISKATKGKPKSDEHKAKIGAARKGKKVPVVICPHCNKSGGITNMKRYHFDKCKSIT